ncbi:Transaldolase [Aphelenchoides besseyi]|nr:Transaldolase [Aphelenchoides besseyi]
MKCEKLTYKSSKLESKHGIHCNMTLVFNYEQAIAQRHVDFAVCWTYFRLALIKLVIIRQLAVCNEDLQLIQEIWPQD